MSKEDMFSSDLTDKQLYEQLGHLHNIPVLIVMCGDDEYVPDHVNKEKLLKRMCKAIATDANNQNMIQSCIIPKADHYLTDKAYYQQFISLCITFIQPLSPKSLTFNCILL